LRITGVRLASFATMMGFGFAMRAPEQEELQILFAKPLFELGFMFFLYRLCFFIPDPAQET